MTQGSRNRKSELKEAAQLPTSRHPMRRSWGERMNAYTKANAILVKALLRAHNTWFGP